MLPPAFLGSLCISLSLAHSLSLANSLLAQNEEEAAKQEALGGARVYRTTHLYSATMPVSVERLARKYLRRPAYVAIGEVGKAVDRIEQRVEFCKSDMDKRKILMVCVTSCFSRQLIFPLSRIFLLQARLLRS